MKAKKRFSVKGSGKVPKRSRRYPSKYRLKTVKPYLEEGDTCPDVPSGAPAPKKY